MGENYPRKIFRDPLLETLKFIPRNILSQDLCVLLYRRPRF